MSKYKLQKNGLTQEEYIQIKTMLSIPLKNTEIEKRSGRSWPTIRNVQMSNSYDNYHQIGREQALRAKEKSALYNKIVTQKTEQNTVEDTEAETATVEKTPTRMTFGERQSPEENEIEKIERASGAKIDEMLQLGKEAVEYKRQLVEVNKELVAKQQAIIDLITENSKLLGLNTEALKELTTAIRE
jgi:hypothetical protein